MKQILIEKFGENLGEMFMDELSKTEIYIRKHYGEVEKVETKYSPEMCATVGRLSFSVEVQKYNYIRDGIVVCELMTMFDLREAYFFITAEYYENK